MKHINDIKIAYCLRLLSVFGSLPQSHSPLCSFSTDPNPSQNPQLRIQLLLLNTLLIMVISHEILM